MASYPPAKKLKVKVTKERHPNSLPNILEGYHVYIVEEGLGKVRCNILKQQVTNHGGCVEKECSEFTTHIFVNKSLRKGRLLEIIKRKDLGSKVKVLFADWLSACFIKGELLEYGDYFAYLNPETSDISSGTCNMAKMKSYLTTDYVVDLHGDTEENNEVRKASSYDTHELYQNRDDANAACSSGFQDKDDCALRNSRYEHSESGLGCGNSSLRSPVKEKLRNSHCKDYRSIRNAIEYEFGSSSDEDKWPIKIENNDIKVEEFVCGKPSSCANENFNSYITDKLEVLQKAYTSTQDRWRSLGYKKAINSIKNFHKKLETYEEVSQLPFIGEGIAKKVWEIIETGHLRKLDHLDPKVKVLNTFAGVWGAGPKTAEQWYAMGFRTLKDLQEKAELTFQQKVGLKHYDDINEKMPRSEVSEIEHVIRKHADELLPGVKIVICGSYRRGRQFCGDIDILVSHPDGRSHEGFLLSLLNTLKEVKLITDDLITVDNDTQRKYMGLCKLAKDNSKYRRIDFIVAPYEEWPLALLHFTGSAHFNRSMRLLAKKKNMSLSEHALRENVVRGARGEKIQNGKIVPVSSEEDVFQYLGLDFLEANERDW